MDKKLIYFFSAIGITVLLFLGQQGYSHEQRQSNPPNMIGIGILSSERPYREIDTTTAVIPIIVWQYKGFFIEGFKAGYTCTRSKHLQTDIIVQPRFMGYDTDDNVYYAGMQDRDYSLEAGAQVQWFLSSYDMAVVTQATHDIASTYEGYECAVALSQKYDFKIGQFKPSVGLKWQSKKMIDYYYGVAQNESVSGRPAYFPQGTINYYASFNLFLGFSEQWLCVVTGSYEWFGDDIRDSPLTDKKGVLTGVLGITQRF